MTVKKEDNSSGIKGVLRLRINSTERGPGGEKIGNLKERMVISNK